MSTYIFESENIESILDFIRPDSLFIFDIDHTLIETAQVIGSTHWEKHFARRLMDQGIETDLARSQAQTLWKKIQRKTKVRPVDPTLFKLIHYLKTHNVKTLGLTSRDEEIIDLTLDQLQSVDMHEIFNFDDPCHDFGVNPSCHFSKGIVFCSDNPKDIGLKLFLEHTQHKPEQIIFIDDQKQHLYELEEMAYRAGISYVGMQYTASGYERFNAEIAKIQEKHLPHIITDDQAIDHLRQSL